ncbi:MAG TPA: guanylate kinase [Accumulibacter sp.]|uniref:Guanylate kinase n=2 Tax=Candidatus Accumulibacter TaxID=327159 RepID=A0A080M6I9_9PROT|nr:MULTISPECIES: guanylate kinase [Candidatus Accumulibacter]KFB76912.1 MAG: Guanylate kinase [Candidatus Accumulibacter cognatus]MBL8400344.1 guanylate kinase [Accumulibacter sp.]MBN8517387.1 guanylate kinase [Accumulibacter sp.]MBO3710605.1 guanylate kinase [Accumulibacter sp.]MCC2867724.1 guanylate kinase [Candidatus Accumulibacter phosphatis]
MTGHLLIVTAPSGAGKTTLVRLLLENDPDLSVSISHSTRAPRPGERDGVEYHFVSVPDFLEKVRNDAFLEWAEVHGNYYGTSRSGIEAALLAGQDVLLEIDWQGAQQVRALFPAAIGVFVLPPSLDELERRLCARATDSAETIARRVAAAREEMRHVAEFDYVIINDELQRALHDLLAVVRATRLRYAAQRQRHSILFATML